MAKTRRRKKRSHVAEAVDPSKKSEPRTFVFRRGKHWGPLGDLEQDLRRMMAPNTASALRESKRNTLKDFVAVAGPLGVSHFLILTATDKSTYLRVARTPRGPTLTLRVKSYSLMSDVASSQARPRVPPNAFKSAPLVVLNNFGGGAAGAAAAGGGGRKELALAGSLFQGMFPSINVHTANLATCQRVVLLSADPASGAISLRHYTISTAPSGIKRPLKALVMRQAVPDMGALRDVSELVTKSGYGSESEGEEAEASRVVLPAAAPGRAGRALAGRQSRVRLHEVGPRLELEIVKVEQGLCEGAVLYHAHVSRSRAEASAQQAAKDEAARLKAQRRQQQEENVRRKQAEERRRAELQRAAEAAKLDPAAAAAAARKKWWGEQQREEREAAAARAQEGGGSSGQEEEAEDDDIAYYRQEVGEEPDEADKVGLQRPHSGGRGRGRGGRGGGGRGGGRGSSGGSDGRKREQRLSEGRGGSGSGGKHKGGHKRAADAAQGHRQKKHRKQ